MSAARRITLIALSIVLLSPAHAARPCGGDCNEDGAVGIAELIAAVAAAVGGDDTIACGFDRDDDGLVAVDELVRLVGIALEGCPLPFDLALVDGVHDVDASGQSDPSGGFNKLGVAAVERDGDALRMTVHFGALETLDLRGEPTPEGALELSGDGMLSGEVPVTMRGRVQVTSVGGVVELNGEMEYRFENVPTGIVLDVVVRRPLSGTPTARGGAYRFSLRHPMLGGAALTSRIDLPLVLQPSGRGLCGATADVVDDETVRAELAQSECLVSAGGRIHYAVPYRVPDAAAAPLLQMTGSIVGSGGAPGRGAFLIGDLPEVVESGVWEAARGDSLFLREIADLP